MKIDFKHISDEVTDKLKAKTSHRLRKLARILDTDEQESLVIVEIQKNEGTKKPIDAWSTSISADHGGKLHFSSANGDSSDSATANAVRELDTEIRRSHGKEKTLRKSAARMIKAISRRVGR